MKFADDYSRRPASVLMKQPCKHGLNRAFRVFFERTKDQTDFEVGMTFSVTSVNRQTGEVKFVLDPECWDHKE